MSASVVTDWISATPSDAEGVTTCSSSWSSSTDHSMSCGGVQVTSRAAAEATATAPSRPGCARGVIIATDDTAMNAVSWPSKLSL